jgi:ABC-type uncharacterized transport system ATPase subunit
MNAVEMHHITKRFGQYVANDDISIDIHKGEIHAIVGENGAGKSTLMKILYGYHLPDMGTIHIHGKEVNISTPANAIALGIGMVHQHFMLIPALTVMENIILGNEPTKAFSILNLGQAREHVRLLAEISGFSVDPSEKVQNLAIGYQQRVEILKVLYRKAEIIIFDEPTPLLTPQEVDSFLKSLVNLKNEGKTIILITHKLNEVFAVSDHLTILRQGKAVRSMKTNTTNTMEVARLMTGQDLPASPAKETPPHRVTVLELNNVSLRGNINQASLRNVNFSLKSGEILGIAGVEGNGQTPLVQILLGLQKPTSGEIRVHRRNQTSRDPLFSHIPDDRLKNGIIPEFNVQENLILGRQNELGLSVKSIFRRQELIKFSSELIHNYNIQPSDQHLKIRNLSGGNQQKVVVARELSKKSVIIIANQPTRGLDIKAIDFVHSNLIRERNAGRAIILISSDLSELVKLSDRIAVIFEGSITAVLEASATSDQELGLYMTGVRRQSA